MEELAAVKMVASQLGEIVLKEEPTCFTPRGVSNYTC